MSRTPVLYRIELSYIDPIDKEKKQSGLFTIPDNILFDSKDEIVNTNLWYSWYSIFEFQLVSPDLCGINTISYFTEKGYRHFRKHLKLCREYTKYHKSNIEWIDIRIPRPDKVPIYEDHYQVIFERDGGLEND